MQLLMVLKRGLPWLGVLLTGLFLFAAFPPLEQNDLAWIALVPLWLCIRNVSPRRAFTLGFLAGCIFWLSTVNWLTHVSFVGWIILSLYCALYLGLFAWLMNYFMNRWPEKNGSNNMRLLFLAPVLWIGCEYLRSSLFTGFAWNALGVSQYKKILLIQIAALGGVYAVSALIVILNAAIAITVTRYIDLHGKWRRQMHPEMMVAFTILGLSMMYGLKERARHRAAPTNEVYLALLQTNIPQHEKWTPQFKMKIYKRLQTATQLILKYDIVDMIVWPEAALPDLIHEVPKRYDFMNEVYYGGIPILIGAMTVEWPDEGPPAYYNSSFLQDGNGKFLQEYRKQHLVLFGEYIPFQESLPFLSALTPIDSSFDAGDEATIFELEKKDLKFATLICFEDTVAPLARKAVKAGAQLLVNQTNDGWFDISSGSRQHMTHCVFRSIENRVPSVRAGNTGISCSINRLGGIEKSLTGFGPHKTKAEFFIAAVQFSPGENTPTFYTRFGPILAQIGAAIVWFMLGRSLYLRILRRKKNKVVERTDSTLR